MKKGIKQLCCLLLSFTALFSAACVSVAPSGLVPPSSHSGNYWGNNGGGIGGGTSNGGSTEKEDSSPEDDEIGGDENEDDNDVNTEFNPENPVNPSLPELPEPDEPNANKTVANTETDSLGHKIVTYTDGTWEDLGRIEELDYSTPDPTEQYGYEYLGKQANGAGMQDFYRALHTLSSQFHASGNTLQITTTTNGKTCRLADFMLADYGITQSQAAAVWRVFANENPTFFWIDNQLATSSTKLTMLVDDAYATPSARSSAQTKIAEMALDCDQYINGKMTEAVRAATIQDYLAGRIEYAYKSDGVTPETELWAHSLVGAATKNKGVCETYAKTYDYLCTLFDINCLMVAGRGVTNGSSVGHAWNVVEIDGEWYDVDVTWNDIEKEKISREWFGKETSEFSQSHIARTPKDGWDLNFQYALPTRCNKSLNLVSYGIYNSESYTLAGSVQAAFEQMTKTNQEYSVYLYPHTNASEKMGLKVENKGGAETVTFPQVQAMLFIGNYAEYAGGSYTLSEFTLKGDCVLPCHFLLQDVRLFGGSLDNSNRIVATMGTMAEINIPIHHQQGTESAIWAQTTKGTLLNEYADAQILAASDDVELRICGGGYFEQAVIGDSATMCCYGQESVTFDYLECNDNARLYIAKTASSTSISIGEFASNASNKTVTIAIDCEAVSKYPNLHITTFSSEDMQLNLQFYGAVAPSALSRIMTLEKNYLFSNVQIYKSGGTYLRAEDMSKYAIDSYGVVRYVG